MKRRNFLRSILALTLGAPLIPHVVPPAKGRTIWTIDWSDIEYRHNAIGVWHQMKMADLKPYQVATVDIDSVIRSCVELSKQRAMMNSFFFNQPTIEVFTDEAGKAYVESLLT